MYNCKTTNQCHRSLIKLSHRDTNGNKYINRIISKKVYMELVKSF